MANPKQGLFKKRIPTVLGLLILLVGAGAGIFFISSGQSTNFLPRASAEYAPKQFKISNVSDRSFTVSWITDIPTTGFLRYGTTTSLGTTMEDERDQLSGSAGSSQTHYVTVRGLEAGSKYYFKIGSGPGSDLYDNNGQAYEVSLGGDLGPATSSQVASGTVMTNAQAPANGSIIYLTLPNGAPMSALVRASGSWAITLSNARNQNLTSYLEYTPTDLASIQVIGPDGIPTSGSLVVGQLNPAPTITLGQPFGNDTAQANTEDTSDDDSYTDGNQDFDNMEEIVDTMDSSATESSTLSDDSDDASDSGSLASQFDLDPLEGVDSATTSSTIVFNNPSYDGEVINTTLPKFTGGGLSPGTVLEVMIESDPVYNLSIVADEDGDFTIMPPDDLEPGEHTLTASYIDGNGEKQTIVRTFVIAAPGDSELPALTSSASGETVPTPAASSSSRISQPSSSSGIPTAGILTPTITIFIMGVGLILSGILISYKQNQY